MRDSVIRCAKHIIETDTRWTVLTPEWPIHLYKEPDSSDGSVTIYPTGSHEPASPKWLLDFPTFQVRVRGASRKGGLEPHHRTDVIKRILLGLTSTDVNRLDDAGQETNELFGRLVSITMPMDIMSIGYTDHECVVFVANFNVIFEPTPIGALQLTPSGDMRGAEDNRIPL